MRILYVTNYFPPHHIGGYELHCGQAAAWLANHGHTVRVLTSDFRLPGAADETATPGLEIHRRLKLRYWTDIASPGYWMRERRDLAVFRRQVRAFRPDVVVIWNLFKLASGIALEAQRLAPVLVYHLMDEWAANFRDANGLPQFWARPARSAWGRLLKPPLRAAYRALLTPDVSRWETRNAVLVSRALGELLAANGVHFKNVHISYITYDADRFAQAPERAPAPDGAVRFLWAGRLCRGKGLTTTLDALDALHHEIPGGWSVDFCGPIESEDKAELLDPRLTEAPWRDKVRYLGSLPHDEMPAQYTSHDAFLFTSEVHEGLPGTIIEAFAAGLPVIGTLTGGTKDVLRPDDNCLVYPQGDAPALAQAMARIIQHPRLRATLSSEVQRFAQDQCGPEAVFPRLADFYERALKLGKT